jgi:hypothetical protein
MTDDKEKLRREIAQQTEEYLARGGKIQKIPFLTTTKPNDDVLEYIRIHRHGYYMLGAPAHGYKGRESIEQVWDGLSLEEQ